MRIEKCHFCGVNIYPGHGVMFVRNDCSIFRFCRGKCHKAFKKRRNPRKVKWTKASRKVSYWIETSQSLSPGLQARGKDLAVDPVFELERQRDEPTKYSRELWTQTVEAMKEIATIAHKRQSHHIKQRLKKGTLQRRKADAVTVKKHMALIRSPAANMLNKDEVKDEQKDDIADVQMAAVASVIKDRLRKKTKKTKMQKEMAMEMN